MTVSATFLTSVAAGLRTLSGSLLGVEEQIGTMLTTVTTKLEDADEHWAGPRSEAVLGAATDYVDALGAWSTRRSAGDDRRSTRGGRPVGDIRRRTRQPAVRTRSDAADDRRDARGPRGPLQGARRHRRGRGQLDLGVDVVRRRDRHVSRAARGRFDANRLQPAVPVPTARRHRVHHCRQPIRHHEHGAALDHRSEWSDRARRGRPPRLAVQHRDRAADLHDHRDRPRARHRRVRRTLERGRPACRVRSRARRAAHQGHLRRSRRTARPGDPRSARRRDAGRGVVDPGQP